MVTFKFFMYYYYMRTIKPVLLLCLFLLCICPLFAEPAEESAQEPEETNLAEEESDDEEIIAIAQEPETDSDDEYDDFDDSVFFDAPTLVFEVPVFETRSFEDIFPGFSASSKRRVMSSTGLRYSFEKDGEAAIIPAPDSGIEIIESFVMKKKPSHVIEALIIVPYGKRELDMLDLYNALGKIKEIKDHLLDYRDNKYQIFKDTTRIESAKNRKPIADPEPVSLLPLSETMYVRFTDAYIGELYLRGEISISPYGITYSMTNFRDVNYSIFRIMKAERFSAIIYLEPIKEGILIYSASGLYLPGFIVSRLNLTFNINNRITVLLNWIKEGLRRQEALREKPSVPFAVN